MYLIYPVCSSSKGNAVYVGSRESGILLDCGIGIRGLTNALKLQSIALSAIKAVFVTHEHSDHIKGLAKLGENIPIAVYGNVPTLRELIAKSAVRPGMRLKEIDRKAAEVCGLSVRPFRTSHDSADSMGYHVTFPNGKRVCLSTDLGYVSKEVDRNLCDSDVVMLESNYEEEMLINGSYPQFLKERIQSDRGHLSNRDCAAETVRLAQTGIDRFILGHLSEENNRPETALAVSANALAAGGIMPGRDCMLTIAPKMTAGKAVDL